MVWTAKLTVPPWVDVREPETAPFMSVITSPAGRFTAAKSSTGVVVFAESVNVALAAVKGAASTVIAATAKAKSPFASKISYVILSTPV